ncbi:MAG: hypothetical protein ACYSWS_05795 [Planctomycetota bacterium]
MGDFGYTTISLQYGFDFESVGFNYASGDNSGWILYELWNDGASILTGYTTIPQNTMNYLGFSGGAFDIISNTFNAV